MFVACLGLPILAACGCDDFTCCDNFTSQAVLSSFVVCCHLLVLPHASRHA